MKFPPSTVFLPALRSTGIILFHHYYELVRFPMYHLRFLTGFQLVTTYQKISGNALGLPSSHIILLIPCHGLRLRRARITSPITAMRILPSASMNSVGLRDDDNFGAQSLHLCCGLVSHPPRFTIAGYPTRCRIQF